MKCNVGKKERLGRVIAGLLFAGTGIAWGRLPALLGAFVILTAIIGWCPISRLLGISTCETDEEIPVNTSGQNEPQKHRDHVLK